MKKILLALIILATSCAPNIQAKQARAKHKADTAHEKPKNNWLPLVGIACLSMWVIDRMQGEN